MRVTTTLGWWERERGEKQSTPSITSTADSHQPKRSRLAHCSQSDMPQRKEKTSTWPYSPSTGTSRRHPLQGCLQSTRADSGKGWEASDRVWKVLRHSRVVQLGWYTCQGRGEVLRNPCFSYARNAFWLCDITSQQVANAEATALVLPHL